MATWYKMAKQTDWENFAALKGTFASADQVGNCVVFDVGNNRYRLIGRVVYAKGRLYVLKVMDPSQEVSAGNQEQIDQAEEEEMSAWVLRLTSVGVSLATLIG